MLGGDGTAGEERHLGPLALSRYPQRRAQPGAASSSPGGCQVAPAGTPVAQAAPALPHRHGGGAGFCWEQGWGNLGCWEGLESERSVGFGGGMPGEKPCREGGVKGPSSSCGVGSLAPRARSK